MRLLDTETGEFVERKPEDIKFAILSHTWDEKGEQSYQELRDILKRHTPGPQPLHNQPRNLELEHGPRTYAQFPTPNGSRRRSRIPSSSQPSYRPPSASTVWTDPELSPKIRDACAVARASGYRYLWIDSCCIDKTSSSELSEAINSMYQWYSDAEVCYAFLADVPANEDHGREGSFFRRSRWFTRGWTLQELIAPAHVVFFAMDWKFVGTKNSLSWLVTQITGISHNALLRVEPLHEFSVAQRLSWAARRQTTRVEDRAYSLLGIFDINMPTLYGEGDRAFRRLQEEVMQRIPDQSLFAWALTSPLSTQLRWKPETTSAELASGLSTNPSASTHPSLLAPSLDTFTGGWTIEAISDDEVIRRLQYLQFPAPKYTFTPHGIRTKVLTIPLSICVTPETTIEYFPRNIPPSYWYLVILGCEYKNLTEKHLLGRVCYMSFSGSSTIEFVHCGQAALESGAGTGPQQMGIFHPSRHWADLLPLSITTIQILLSSQQINLKSVYIPHPDRPNKISDVVRRLPHESIRLVLPKTTSDALNAEGYTANLEGPNIFRPHQPTAHWLSLSNKLDGFTIVIEYHHSLHQNGRALTLEAHVTSTKYQVYPNIISWTDSLPWRWTFGNRQVVVGDQSNTQLYKTITMNLDVHLATKDHYFLHVELLGSQMPIPPCLPPIDLPPIE